MRTRLALVACLAGTWLLGVTASAQALQSAPDLIVSVHRDNVGSDIVDVGARSPQYPSDLLASQLEALGQALGSTARGVSVTHQPLGGNETAVKGMCAVDGLIDRKTGHLGVAAVAQAFAGAPAPYTVHRLLVSFDGERTGPKTIQRFSNRDLAFTGRIVGSSIEYNVELKSQDPKRLVVHEGGGAAPRVLPSRGGFDPLTYVLGAVAVAAAGALVYCLLVLLGRRNPTQNPR